MRPSVGWLLSLGVLSGCAVTWRGSLDHQAPRDAVVEGVDTISEVVVEASAGTLVVRGTGSSGARVSGIARASTEELLDEVDLVVRREGSRVLVRAVLPEVMFGSTALDLDVEMPRTAALDVSDGSGSLEVVDVARATVRDGSGSLTLTSCGPVSVTDGSGSVTVRDVEGPVEIRDGSGAIEVVGVRGEVRLWDGSGRLTVRDVDGGVTVEDDGSGAIDIHDVDGDVHVRDDGSGSIDVSDVTGDLVVGDEGAGSVSWRRVGGAVRVPRD